MKSLVDRSYPSAIFDGIETAARCIWLINPKSDEFAFSTRDTHQLEEKEAIAKVCAAQIRSNQSVIIDAGTGDPPAELAKHADRILLVTRRCYLSLRRAVASRTRQDRQRLTR